MPKLNATIYTHTLNYTRVGNESGTASLEGRVTFDDQATGHNTDTSSFGESLNTNFITNITYTYIPSTGAAAQTLVYADFDGFKIAHNGSNTDFDGDPNLKTQLSELQFQGSNANAFTLALTGTAFKVEVAADNADFLLSSTTYHSPAPLPILGLLSSFGFMKKLKEKYKLKSEN